MMSCRPYYLQLIFFVDGYLPPQTDAGTKTALNEVCTAMGATSGTPAYQLSTGTPAYQLSTGTPAVSYTPLTLPTIVRV